LESSKKRSRENKLREKAQQKREKREQRKFDKQQASGSPEAFPLAAATELSPEFADAGPMPDAAVDGDSSEDPAAAGMAPPAESAAPAYRGKRSATKLYVGNLPRTVTDRTLSDFVAAAGFTVASVVVIRDKISGEAKGFGFIQLAEDEDATRVIRTLDGREFDGRRLAVSEARPPRVDVTRLRTSVRDMSFSRRKH
jgi:RNA recognition motif